MSDTEVDAIPADSSITENTIPVKEEIYNRISDRELSDCHPNDPKILHRKSVVLENLVHFVFVVSRKDFNKYTELLRWFKEIERTVEKKGHDLKYETQDSRLFKCRYDEKVHDISEKAIFILPLLSESFMDDAFCRFFNTEVIGKTRLDDTCDEGIMGSILKEQKQDAVRPIFLTHGTAKFNRPPGFLMMKGIDYCDKKTNMEYVQNQIKDIIEEAIERVEQRRNAMVGAAFTKRDTTIPQRQTSDSMANLSTAVENLSIGNIGSSTTTSESVALLEMENGSSRHIQGYNTCESSRDQDQDLADRAFSADSGARRRKDIGPNIRNAVKVDVGSSVQSELKEKQPGKRNEKESKKSETTVYVFKGCTNIQVGDGSVIVMKEEKSSDGAQENTAKKETRLNTSSATENPAKLVPAYPFSNGTDNQIDVLPSIGKAKVSNSVGLIYIQGKPAGTGFRVGEKYILTCLHVIKDIIKTQMDMTGQQQVAINSCEQLKIEFQRIKPLQEENPLEIFGFKPYIPYKDEDIDVAVLELRNHDAGICFPQPLTRFREFCPTDPIHFVGHPGGRQMKEDSYVLPKWSYEAKKYIKYLKNWSLLNSPTGLDYYRVLLETPRKLVFHTSFNPGSSGSPGVMIKDATPCVVLMLSGGTPSWFYEGLSQICPVPDSHRVEFGYTMTDINFKMLNSAQESVRMLASEIFRNWK